MVFCHIIAVILNINFVNQLHSHIVTDNLNVVENISLRELMDFCLKYHILSKYGVNDILTQLDLYLDLFIY